MNAAASDIPRYTQGNRGGEGSSAVNSTAGRLKEEPQTWGPSAKSVKARRSRIMPSYGPYAGAGRMHCPRAGEYGEGYMGKRRGAR